MYIFFPWTVKLKCLKYGPTWKSEVEELGYFKFQLNSSG